MFDDDNDDDKDDGDFNKTDGESKTLLEETPSFCDDDCEL